MKRKLLMGLIMLSISGIVLMSGCTENGKVHLATIEMKVEDVTTTSIKESSLQETTIEEPIQLEATIFSTSTEKTTIHNPILILKNNGRSEIENIGIDAELYKGNELIVAKSVVSYRANIDTYIHEVPPGESVRGELIIYWYNGNVELPPGRYLLKVLVRKGANAIPIAIAEKKVTIEKDY